MADGILTPCNVPCGTITTLISSGDCTLQCGKWLWNRDSEFTKWQHRSRHVILYQSAKFYPNRTTLGRKNDVMSIFMMAEVSHLGL